MPYLRRRLQRVVWIALVAMFGLALAPSLSRAFAASSGFDPWAELCSSVGSKPAGQTPHAPTDVAATPHHCPLCSHIADAPLLPAPAVAALTLPDGADFIPALFAQAPHPLFAWATAQARAPPSVS